MRKLPFILFAAMAAVVSIGAGQGCGDSTTNTGGAGPGGGNPGAGGTATTQGTGGTTSSSPNTGGSTGDVNPTSSGGSTPGTGGSPGTGGGSPACGGNTPVALTIVNYKIWCNVKIGNGTYDGAASQTVCVAADAQVDLAAQANSAVFKVEDDIWHGTDDDMGTLNPPTNDTSTTTITVGANGSKCAWVCCPFQNGTGCEAPPQDPCGGP